jgi:uncharacterized protein (TIGR02271 family)
MPTIDQAQTWHGRDAMGADGDKLGTIDEIYVDKQTGEPEWMAVKTGLFGTKLSFVPLADAREDGDAIAVPYDKAKVKDAPRVDADGELSEEEEAALYTHYGREYRDHTTNGHETVGHDTSGPTTDDAMTRSEEELRVGTAQREVGRARLRKVVVTENVETTVPVQREEVRVVSEPITDGNVDDALDGPAISEEEHEVTLHAEEPVVEKRVVPKERVRLEKDTVTEEQTVSEQVRKEQIDTDRGH